MEKEYVIGVDLGGTKVEACLLDSDRKLLSRYREPSEAALGLDHVIEKIVGVIAQTAGHKNYSAVGMGTPGTYMPSQDRLFGSPHTLVYESPGFIRRLQDRLPVPLLVENDANCLALAEYYASCAGQYHYVMAVILGTGVGSGLILNDRIYRGAQGGAGEIGHTTIDFSGRLCECGRKGCVEAYLSGPSHTRRFFEISAKKFDVPKIYELYLASDPLAKKLFTESCAIMGEVFANVVNVLDLDAIILGGGVSNLPLWYEKVPALLGKSLFGVDREKLPLIKARLGDSAGVFGAAYLALRERGFMSF